jgi:hypothetical protein
MMTSQVPGNPSGAVFAVAVQLLGQLPIKSEDCMELWVLRRLPQWKTISESPFWYSTPSP